MAAVLKGYLIVLVSTVLGTIILLLIAVASHLVALPVAAIIGAIIGLLYGLEAGILLIYDLDAPKGWVELLLDLTWSFPNTVFGFVLGNLIYPFLGSLSREQSEGQGWIVYAREAELHQTLGTVNLGGAGQHER